jgi:SP family general alpha glucoside:H+ symporter-like MFS transporter
MTLLEGIRLYPNAILWSVLISTCIVMEGYDICLINNFCGCLSLSRYYCLVQSSPSSPSVL